MLHLLHVGIRRRRSRGDSHGDLALRQKVLGELLLPGVGIEVGDRSVRVDAFRLPSVQQRRAFELVSSAPRLFSCWQLHFGLCYPRGWLSTTRHGRHASQRMDPHVLYFLGKVHLPTRASPWGVTIKAEVSYRNA